MHAYCSTFNTSNSAKHCQKYANIYPSQQAEGILSLFEESTASSFCCMRMQGVAGILECSHTPRHCATLRADELSQSAPSVESAVTSTSLLHRSEHLCKHRATAAKHRCWQTVNTPPTPPNNALLSNLRSIVFLYFFLHSHWGITLSSKMEKKKPNKIDYSIYFPSGKIGDREGMSSAPAACFCLEYSRRAICTSTTCPLLQHLYASFLQ